MHYSKTELRARRHKRVRAKISGTSTRPRMAVFRSNRHIELQIIDDSTKKTLVAARDSEVAKGKKNDPKMKTGEALGEFIAKKAGEKGITSIVFDRGGYGYHGIVKAVAEGARKGGLKF